MDGSTCYTLQSPIGSFCMIVKSWLAGRWELEVDQIREKYSMLGNHDCPKCLQMMVIMVCCITKNASKAVSYMSVHF